MSIQDLAETVSRYERAVVDALYRQQLAKEQQVHEATDEQLIKHYRAHAECLRQYIAYKKAKLKKHATS